VLIVGETPLSIEDVVAVARKEKQVALPTSADSTWHRLPRSVATRRRRHLWRDHGLWRLVLG